MYFIMYADGRHIIDGETDDIGTMLGAGLEPAGSLGDERKYVNRDVPGVAVYVRPHWDEIRLHGAAHDNE